VRRQAEAELRAVDRKKDEFLATLAHELRNPLAPMTNAVALVRRSNADGDARDKAIAILDRQLRHMVRLIDDLLDVSRVATGKLSLHMENVDLVAVLRSAVELAEPAAAARRLDLTGRWPPVPCPMVGDSARLLQVFSNLLNNACRYTPPGGRIEVEATASAGGSLQVTVRDTGVGIDAAMQHRIFELFEQADKSLERGNTGLGIGLTLARQLVQLHGGEIEVQSEGIGRGSTFIVRLPQARVAPAIVAAPAAAAPTGTAGAMRLVIADDNVDFAESLQAILEMQGHQVVVVGDGNAALEAVRMHRPDAAVLDIGMPGLNGYEVARRLRADPGSAALTLIAVTGWGQAADKKAAADAGFDRHLVKPLDPEELLDVIADVAPRGAAPDSDGDRGKENR